MGETVNVSNIRTAYFGGIIVDIVMKSIYT